MSRIAREISTQWLEHQIQRKEQHRPQCHCGTHMERQIKMKQRFFEAFRPDDKHKLSWATQAGWLSACFCARDKLAQNGGMHATSMLGHTHCNICERTLWVIQMFTKTTRGRSDPSCPTCLRSRASCPSSTISCVSLTRSTSAHELSEQIEMATFLAEAAHFVPCGTSNHSKDLSENTRPAMRPMQFLASKIGQQFFKMSKHRASSFWWFGARKSAKQLHETSREPAAHLFTDITRKEEEGDKAACSCSSSKKAWIHPCEKKTEDVLCYAWKKRRRNQKYEKLFRGIPHAAEKCLNNASKNESKL